MKKLIALLLIIPFVFACSDDKDETQDYTSFVVKNETSIEKLPNTVIGYKVGNNYKKVAELGNIKKGETSKEIIIEDKSIKELYLFADYSGVIRADIVYNLKLNKKNIFILPSGIKGIEISDKTDPTQYPQ